MLTCFVAVSGVVEREGDTTLESRTCHHFSSYKDSVLKGLRPNGACFESTQNEGEVSDDDVIEEEDDETCFSIGMTRAEKIKARRPWLNCLIVKLVGRSIGYHYLWRRIQATWRTQDDPLLIDLGLISMSSNLEDGKNTSGRSQKFPG